MPLKLIVARHGERLDRVDPSWKSRAEHPSDPPLTEEGILQARALGEHMQRTERVSAIYVSPFTRTLQTANEVASVLDLPLFVEHGLCEWLNEEWFDGKPLHYPSREEAIDAFPRIDATYQTRVMPKFPESNGQVRARAKTAAHAIVGNHIVHGRYEDATILLVAHGKIVEDCVIGLTGGDLLPWITYCSVSHVVEKSVDGKGTFVRGDIIADTSFIPDTIRPVALRTSYA